MIRWVRGGSALRFSAALAAFCLAFTALTPAANATVFTSESDIKTSNLVLEIAHRTAQPQNTDDDLRLDLRVSNTGSAFQQPSSVELFLETGERASRAALTAALPAEFTNGEPIPEGYLPLGSHSIAELREGAHLTTQLEIDNSVFHAALSEGTHRRPTVYRLVARLTAHDGTVTVATHPLLIAPHSADIPNTAEAPNTTATPAAEEVAAGEGEQTVGEAPNLSIVVPIIYPSNIATLPTEDDLALVFEPSAPLPQLLTTAEQLGATLAVDPRIFVGIRALGAAAPAAATEFLTRLENTALETYILPWGDTDLAAQQLLQLASPLTATGASFITKDGIFPGSAPTLAELETWEAPQLAWFAAGSASSAAVGYAATHGFPHILAASSDLLMSDTAVRTQLNTGSATAYDETLAGYAAAATAAADSFDRNLALTELLAGLTTADGTDEPLVLTLDRTQLTDNNRGVALLKTLLTAGYLDTTNLEAQVSGVGQYTHDTAVTDDELEKRLAALDEALQREAEVTAGKEALLNPQQLVDYQRARLLALFGMKQVGTETPFLTLASGFADRDELLTRGVHLVAAPQLQLFGSSANVPVQVRNNLPFTAQVTVRAHPTSAAISIAPEDTEHKAVTVMPGETVTLTVPISSRVSSADTGLTVRISDTTGEQGLGRIVIPIRLSTNVEIIGLSLVGVLALGLITFGIVRSVRQHRAGLRRTLRPN
ncbi:DUF6049 family protein [Canibacter zhoujuaniae]|uniref:DUF6049 family protein n=1 Tax=Canibacter zhoujuaniae TaxID=2708343 RepID=UPI00141E5421|nr:DUF6049 family protein [Canibacter zhoujuaniae]